MCIVDYYCVGDCIVKEEEGIYRHRAFPSSSLDFRILSVFQKLVLCIGTTVEWCKH